MLERPSATHLCLTHLHTQTHAGIKLTQWKTLQGYLWRQKRWRDFTRGLFLLSSLTHCLRGYAGYTHTHTYTQMRTHALSELPRPRLRSQWQQWVCCSDVSVQHCMSCPVYFGMCSHSTLCYLLTTLKSGLCICFVITDICKLPLHCVCTFHME